jgi:hypothetical protein
LEYTRDETHESKKTKIKTKVTKKEKKGKGKDNKRTGIQKPTKGE